MDYITVSTIRNEVGRLGLVGMDEVLRLSIEGLAACYNGTGPDWMPDFARNALDGICAPFLPAVMVHDVEFTQSDGTVESFNMANDHLLENCVKCALDAHPWYSWRRYALFAKAIAIYRACCKFGWKAWTDAYTDAHLN